MRKIKLSLKDKIWIVQNATSQEVKALSEHGKWNTMDKIDLFEKLLKRQGDFQSLST